MGVSIIVGGDCGPAYDPDQTFGPSHFIERIAPTLSAADFRLVNCMRTYSSRARIAADAPQVSQPVHMADLYTAARFDGVTMANNHAYDSGPEALVDTADLFRGRGIQVTGAGRDLAEATRPVILEKEGLRIAYLGVTSVGKDGSAATIDKPGIFSVRIRTGYEHRGAHAPVRVLTEPEPDDLTRLIETVRTIRSSVDSLVVAFHSGVIRLPRVISDYQVTVSHALIDAGVDLVVCHAPHIPKGVEVYRGKAIFYSIGVFAMTKSFPAPSWLEPAWAHGAVRNHTDLDPSYPMMPYGRDSRFALLARGIFNEKGVQRVSFLPIYFDEAYRPEALSAKDPRFDEVLRYIEWASVDLPHRFTVVDDEVVVTG
ncbi:CapA family protein [Devosia sp. CN2-171]|uniref:CapA family protein n=1 Tax=Devosia sp. CN2-171 TaxID=3400909 RepID=UPI003BF82013